MGDITDRPKTPKSQVVYVPQYVYTPASTTPSSGSNTNVDADDDSAETPAQQREKNLLSRTRSRVGTILTGFRGILAPSDTQGQRKTLLGE